MNLVSISVRILIRLAQNKSITLFIPFSLMTVDLLLYFVIVFHSFFYLNCQKEISLHLIGVHAYACTSAHWLVRMDIQLTIFFDVSWQKVTLSNLFQITFQLGFFSFRLFTNAFEYFSNFYKFIQSCRMQKFTLKSLPLPTPNQQHCFAWINQVQAFFKLTKFKLIFRLLWLSRDGAS